jgi:AmmeMemoRadiSam system protein B
VHAEVLGWRVRIRKAAVAGSWYPGTGAALGAAVDGLLAGADADLAGDVTAIVAPHAGLAYSGPVAAQAYGLLRGRAFDVAVLVGPSHFVAFEGVALSGDAGFETPLGVVPVDEAAAARLEAAPVVRRFDAAHAREHSLEMQLPFLARVLPGLPIVPLVMGEQTDRTARDLADALAAALDGRRALLVASSDLSHYHPAPEAAALDRVVVDHVAAFDPDGLQAALERRPDHACGGGPMVAVMRAARALGAASARVLRYADSGDVSGDKSAVVGYLAAGIGAFLEAADRPDEEAA